MAYSVAIGNRPSGSKRSVRVPTQRHSPAGWGVSRTGGALRASASCDATATMGSENVTERWGASATSPSGAWRTTSSGAPPRRAGRSAAGGGGNGVRTVSPVRGGGSEPSRNANGSSRGSSVQRGSRSSTCSVAAASRGVAGGRATGERASASASPSLSRKTRPVGSSATAGSSELTVASLRGTSEAPPTAAHKQQTEGDHSRPMHDGPPLPPGEDTAGGPVIPGIPRSVEQRRARCSCPRAPPHFAREEPTAPVHGARQRSASLSSPRGPALLFLHQPALESSNGGGSSAECTPGGGASEIAVAHRRRTSKAGAIGSRRGPQPSAWTGEDRGGWPRPHRRAAATASRARAGTPPRDRDASCRSPPGRAGPRRASGRPGPGSSSRPTTASGSPASRRPSS